MSASSSRGWARRGVVAILLAAVTIVPSTSSSASDEERLRRLERELGEARAQHGEAESAVEGVLGELEAIDRKVVAAREDLAAAAAALARAGERRARAEKRLGELEREHDALRERMIERAAGLHRLSHRGVAPLVFRAAEDRRSGARHRRYLGAVLERDRELLDALARNRAEAGAERDRAARAEAEAGRARRRQEEAVARLTAEREAKDRRLARLRDDADQKEAFLRELEGAAERLRELLRRRPRALEAPLSSGGWRPPLESVGTVTAARNGIELDAALGTPVVAARSGRVVFSEWFPGYGRLLVLDHGGHWHTVYGYVEEVLVSPGEEVASGQEIARVGDTGSARRPSLYFEIRRRGEPRDAAAAIGASRVEKAGSAL